MGWMSNEPRQYGVLVKLHENKTYVEVPVYATNGTQALMQVKAMYAGRGDVLHVTKNPNDYT